MPLRFDSDLLAAATVGPALEEVEAALPRTSTDSDEWAGHMQVFELERDVPADTLETHEVVPLVDWAAKLA